ncbi:MotA/TolQ/ExbB proton channel [Thermodesulfatator indicus DSM 15286]|uniref:MotA/TolQ/ExbB proton channel n=1 Tax=Thermodesulfatator indicus (strain DSM 15286 / JCM 11887 / CIR29812) TaxID=667014 RepID=F8AE59_THEID|nr:flagellar motor protein PomA [Thermodesulfatator indicus]AEH44196.1 MotA/TolQ/ExbB proton channel [Thermodesulfatator indicus DSM 15286]
MDLGTVIGLVLGIVLILVSILMGGSLGLFINIPSILIVVGGTIAGSFISFSLADVLGSMKVVMKAFFNKLEPPEEIIKEITNLANIARREGLLKLEKQPINNPFLKKAIMFCVDGHEAEFIEEVLNKEVELTAERHETGQKLFKTMADLAPAFGMIGTLIGLVQMLANMSDPKSIGPSMAVALLTTLYGAVLANLIFMPIANKLELRSQEEQLNYRLIIEGVIGLQKGLNPRVLEEILKAFLPPKKRSEGGE